RASAGAWSSSRRASAPPGAPAPRPPHSSLAFAVLSLFSSSLAAPWPRCWGPFVLVDAILTPTREPSLLSSQVQQGPGHPRLQRRRQHRGSGWTDDRARPRPSRAALPGRCRRPARWRALDHSREGCVLGRRTVSDVFANQRGAIGFAERVLELLDEGRYTATYKYAVL